MGHQKAVALRRGKRRHWRKWWGRSVGGSGHGPMIADHPGIAGGMRVGAGQGGQSRTQPVWSACGTRSDGSDGGVRAARISSLRNAEALRMRSSITAVTSAPRKNTIAA